MSKSNTNRNKKVTKFRARSINHVLTILCVAFLVYAVAITGILLYTLYKIENKVDITTVFANATAEAAKYNYAQLTIDQGVFTSEDNYRAQYVTTFGKDTTYHTYMYRDSEQNDLYQCWQANSDNTGYDAYVYANDIETWVKTTTEEEPVSVDVWSMFEYAGGYTLQEATYPWYDTSEPCYVLTRMSASSEWQGVYEELYIRQSDFLPMGVVLLYTDNNPENLSHEDIVNGVNNAGMESPVNVESNEIVQKYSLMWADEDLKLFDVPETYISDEDYISIVEQREAEEEAAKGTEESTESEEESDNE